MLFILHTVPIASSADSKLIRKSVLLLPPLHKRGPVLDPNNYRMLAVSGTMYRLYVNVLRVYVTEWCQKNNKINDTQFGSYPGRNTLQPMFILRHLMYAAQTKKPHGSPWVHAAFIDFGQAYDSIPGVPSGSTSNATACPPAS